MHLSAMAVPVLLALCVAHPQPGRGQTVSVAAATGPSFLPGSGDLGDWHGLAGVGIERNALGARLEAMYEGVPGADLVALTGNLVWILRRPGAMDTEPYLIAGIGSYVKMTESRFGVNGGVGVRRRMGAFRLFAEMRYHRVTRQFEEAGEADTFVPVSVGVVLGR
jgi:hypothetical protein